MEIGNNLVIWILFKDKAWKLIKNTFFICGEAKINMITIMIIRNQQIIFQFETQVVSMQEKYMLFFFMVF